MHSLSVVDVVASAAAFATAQLQGQAFSFVVAIRRYSVRR